MMLDRFYIIIISSIVKESFTQHTALRLLFVCYRPLRSISLRVRVSVVWGKRLVRLHEEQLRCLQYYMSSRIKNDFICTNIFLRKKRQAIMSHSHDVI